MQVSVLAWMWALDEASAKRVALMFSSMSLGKTVVQRSNKGEIELGLHVHDLHLDFCAREAESAKEKWHFRLLQGNMPSLGDSENEVFDSLVTMENMLKYAHQDWEQKDLLKRSCILQNLTRHLFEAGLLFELWALVLDPQWMFSRIKTDRLPGLKRDLKFLEAYVARYSASFERSQHLGVHASVVKCLNASSEEIVDSSVTTDFSNGISSPSVMELSTIWPAIMLKSDNE